MANTTGNLCSIIDVKAAEARAFFLRTDNYFNNELPVYIDFTELLACISKSLTGKNLNNICTTSKPEDRSDVNYPIITNKDGKFAWRQLDFINPVIYVALVHLITDNDNWEILQNCFEKFRDNGVVECHSLPMWTPEKSNKSANISKWWNDIEQRSISLSLEFESAIATDVVDCYGTLYTHAIAWAIHGKEKAKAEKKNKSLLGNKIDNHIRANRFGQTNGIPQGSSVSDFIAEIVLGYLDCEIAIYLKSKELDKKIKILRFRDDYRIFAKNNDDAEKAMFIISNALRDVGMRLGANKTVVSSNAVRFALKSDKLFDIENLNSRFDQNKLQKNLLIIHALGFKHPNSGSLKRRLSEFFKLVQHRKNAPRDNVVLIAILTDIAFESPSAFPAIAIILSKLLSLEKNKEQKRKLWVDIKYKLSRIPNHAYLDLWLQRIIKPIEKNEKMNSDEPICRLVDGETAIMWNFDWVKDEKILDCIQKNKIIRDLDQVSPVIQSEEIGPVWKEFSI